MKTEVKAKSSLLFRGMELIQFLAALAIFHQDDLKKRMSNGVTATWWNECFGHPVHTIPNIHPTKIDVLPKTLVQIILAASAIFKYVPQPTATNFAFSFPLSFFYELQ